MIHDSEKGFSLLELLIYISIVSIVSLVVADVFISLTRSGGEVEARNEVNSNIRFAVLKMSQDVRAASSITTPASAAATSTELGLTISGSSVTYCISGEQLMRQEGGSCGGASEAITAGNVVVDSILFTRLENTNSVLNKTFVTVVISIDASYNSTAPSEQYSASKRTTVSLK